MKYYEGVFCWRKGLNTIEECYENFDVIYEKWYIVHDRAGFLYWYTYTDGNKSCDILIDLFPLLKEIKYGHKNKALLNIKHEKKVVRDFCRLRLSGE